MPPLSSSFEYEKAGVGDFTACDWDVLLDRLLAGRRYTVDWFGSVGISIDSVRFWTFLVLEVRISNEVWMDDDVIDLYGYGCVGLWLWELVIRFAFNGFVKNSWFVMIGMGWCTVLLLVCVVRELFRFMLWFWFCRLLKIVGFLIRKILSMNFGLEFVRWNWPPELCSAGSFYSDRIRVRKKLNSLGLWRRKDVSVAELIRRVNWIRIWIGTQEEQERVTGCLMNLDSFLDFYEIIIIKRKIK